VPPSAASDLSGLGFFPLYILFGNKCRKKNGFFIFHAILYKIYNKTSLGLFYHTNHNKNTRFLQKERVPGAALT
jgi:hypothetical protein